MKNIKMQLNKELNEAIEDIRFYDVRGKSTEAREAELRADTIKEKLDLLSDIEREGEGNLIQFNDDGTFSMWCIRTPDGGNQIVEYYDACINFSNYDEMIECADCLDVTDEFDTDEISHLVIVTDDLSDCKRDPDVYYLVSNDTLENALFECAYA